MDTTPIQDGVRSFFSVIPLLGERLVSFWNWSLGYITEGGEIKPDFLVNIDALCIMFFQILITWYFARWRPFTTMIVGTAITAVAMAVGVRADYGWMTVLLIVVFSVGEMMASRDRKFLSFHPRLTRCSGAFSDSRAGSHASSGLPNR